MKAHTVRLLEFTEENPILMISFFAKRVNIWYAKTADYIDSLQENCNKGVTEPLGYFDLKKNYHYTKGGRRRHLVRILSSTLISSSSIPSLEGTRRTSKSPNSRANEICR
jgi:hypothetical protein